MQTVLIKVMGSKEGKDGRGREKEERRMQTGAEGAKEGKNGRGKEARRMHKALTSG